MQTVDEYRRELEIVSKDFARLLKDFVKTDKNQDLFEAMFISLLQSHPNIDERHFRLCLRLVTENEATVNMFVSIWKFERIIVVSGEIDGFELWSFGRN